MSSDDVFADWAQSASPQLIRRATMLCGERHLAEDLVQETLVRMYLHWRRIDMDHNPVGYANTTLFRLFISSRRRRSSSELPSQTLPERPGHGPDPDLRLDLLAALQTLPPRQRCVVVARYLDDLSVAEVAALMRRTEGWVRITSHRALRTLRESPLMAISISDPTL